jgi:hypothetical protein
MAFHISNQAFMFGFSECRAEQWLFCHDMTSQARVLQDQD